MTPPADRAGSGEQGDNSKIAREFWGLYRGDFVTVISTTLHATPQNSTVSHNSDWPREASLSRSEVSRNTFKMDERETHKKLPLLQRSKAGSPQEKSISQGKMDTVKWELDGSQNTGTGGNGGDGESPYGGGRAVIKKSLDNISLRRERHHASAGRYC